MIGPKQPHVQIFTVIVHNHEGKVGGGLNDGRREYVLSEMIFEQRARIVGLIIGKVAEDGVRRRLGKIGETSLEAAGAERACAPQDGAENVQEKPETGSQRNNTKQENDDLMPAQADQFSITGR